MELNLETLGFTKEELQQRVVDQLCKELTSDLDYEEGMEFPVDSKFGKKLQRVVEAHIDRKIQEIAENHIFPKVSEYIENLTLQETNKWGEVKGTSLTFVEYMVQRAEAYMTEKVNYEGKAKGENIYSWTGTQTRLSRLIHQHLHYRIENAMQTALKDANSHIVKGLEETIKIKLKEISDSLKVGLKLGK